MSNGSEVCGDMPHGLLKDKQTRFMQAASVKREGPMVALAWAKPLKHQIIQLPKIVDPRGNLSFIEYDRHIPFKIQRSYWLYDVPGGELRDGHAYKTQEEFIVALSGSFDVILYESSGEIRYSMNRSYYGLYIGNLVWRRLENFSTNAFGLILSSGAYDEDDYLRDFQTYKQLTV